MLIDFSVYANIGPQGFKAYSGKVFVETGTYLGKGVEFAIEAGFQTIHSLEIDSKKVEICRNKFKKYSNVFIHHKDSSCELWDVISEIDEPITFWLDANSTDIDSSKPDIKYTYLMDELEQIKRHPIKSHTILIDDMHCSGSVYFDYLEINDIVDKLLEINPNYRIEFIDGGDDGEYPNNVLVAIHDHEENDLDLESDLNFQEKETLKSNLFDGLPSAVSVVIPCKYTHMHLLPEILESLKNQTQLPNEVIITISEIEKDGSTVLNDIKKNTYPFQLKVITSLGVKYAGENRNIATVNAQGNVIITQDADDIPHPQRVEIINYLLNKHHACHLIHLWCPTDPNADYPNLVKPDWVPYYDDFDNIPCFKVRHSDDLKGITFVHHGNIGLKRNVFKVARWRNTRKGQDEEFNRRVISLLRNTLIVREPLVIYRNELSSWRNPVPPQEKVLNVID